MFCDCWLFDLSWAYLERLFEIDILDLLLGLFSDLSGESLTFEMTSVLYGLSGGLDYPL
jgi:hypothetical protein